MSGWQRPTCIVPLAAVLSCAVGAATVSKLIDPAHIHPITLPYGIAADGGVEWVIRNSAEWRAYEQRARTWQQPAPEPCDWSQSMLVVWRAESGQSGCSEPDSGISGIEIADGEYRVSTYVAIGFGEQCMAYFQPIVAACVPASELPVKFDGGMTITVPWQRATMRLNANPR